MPRKRILLVDDDVVVASALGKALERLGRYEVRTETSGRRVVEAARAFEPDLILLDVVMPDLDGGEVAAALAADPQLRDTPVAFLTGMISAAETKDANTDARGRRLIAKPISSGELVRVVGEILGSGSTP